MKVSIRREASAVAILDLDGRFTVEEDMAGLESAISILCELKIGSVVLNMKRITRLDCAGIGRLLRCREKIDAVGGSLKLAELNPRLKLVLEIFHLSAVLENFETEDAAVAGFLSRDRAVSFGPIAGTGLMHVPLFRWR